MKITQQASEFLTDVILKEILQHVFKQKDSEKEIHQQVLKQKESEKSRLSWYTKIIAFISALAATIWASFCVLNYSYVYYSEKNKPKRIAESFKKESTRDMDEVIESGRYIRRSDVEHKILELFQEDRYLLIYGEHTVEKSTTVKYIVKLAREHKIPVFCIQAIS